MFFKITINRSLRNRIITNRTISNYSLKIVLFSSSFHLLPITYRYEGRYYLAGHRKEMPGVEDSDKDAP